MEETEERNKSEWGFNKRPFLKEKKKGYYESNTNLSSFFRILKCMGENAV